MQGKGKQAPRYFIECEKRLRGLSATPAIDFSDQRRSASSGSSPRKAGAGHWGGNQQLRLENTAVAAKAEDAESYREQVEDFDQQG